MSIALIKVDDSLVIGSYNSGVMPLLIKFRSASVGNNCVHYGLLLKTITNGTTSSTTMTITRFYAKSGQNTGIHFGMSRG